MRRALQIWGTWWAVATFWRYLSCAALRRGFQSRPWHTVPWGPRAVQTLPLEPIIKMVLPAFGILGELWLGHEQYMALYVSDGKFNVGNINDWQHSMMYFAFIASGAIDLLGHYAGLPDALEKAFLSLAFLVEGTLLVFHLKGPAIEFRVHLLLCLQIFATVVAIAAEGVMPTSFVAASARPMLTIAQGAWWIQTAYIMYRGEALGGPPCVEGVLMGDWRMTDGVGVLPNWGAQGSAPSPPGGAGAM